MKKCKLYSCKLTLGQALTSLLFVSTASFVFPLILQAVTEKSHKMDKFSFRDLVSLDAPFVVGFRLDELYFYVLS